MTNFIKNPSFRRRVLLCQSWWLDGILEGVVRYATEQKWVLNCDMKWTHRVPKWNGQADGMILSGHDPALRKMAKSAGVPVVSFHYEDDLLGSFKVIGSEEEIGSLAADHLLSLGFKHLGFVTFAEQKNHGNRLAFVEFPKSPSEERRESGFQEAALRGGAVFYSIPVTQLQKRLPSLPRPMGLMASNDSLAIDVIRLLLNAERSIPEEYAVVGVDDTRILCDFAPVPLSSVNCDYERKGYEAARMLDELMHGRKLLEQVRVIPPKGVTGRRSTDTLASPDLETARALRFLRDHAREPFSMEDVARWAGSPLWKLQRTFRQHLGRSMLEELTRLRMETAKILLANPKTKIETVAVESGFSNRFHFYRTFARITGKSPAQFRRDRMKE